METLDQLVAQPFSVVRRRKAETVINALLKRGIGGEYHERPERALQSIRMSIPPGSTVAFGGSVSLACMGVLDALRGMEIELLDRNAPGLSPEGAEEIRRRSLTADVYLASLNAVTADGRIVCIDGSGNRVGAILHGPRQVILLAGTNKIVPSIEEAISRVRNLAAPLNAVRLGKDTPCARTGFCDEPACGQPGRICGQIMVLEMSRTVGRVRVVFVGMDLGY